MHALQALQPTYMLLPNFTFFPGKPNSLKLGTVLKKSKDTKLPDPDRPLNKGAQIPVDADEITKQEFKPWSWDSSKAVSGNLGLTANFSLFTGLGGGIKGERGKDDKLVIKCESVDLERFVPDPAYIAKALKHDLVEKETRKLVPHWVYLVIGTMVAHNAKVEVTRGKNYGGEANFVADGTSAGVPLQGGPEGGFKVDEKGTLITTPTEPFILAYSLIRVWPKRDGTAKEESFNEFALFNDDEVKKTGDEEAQELVENFDIEVVGAEQMEEMEKELRSA